MGRGKGHVGGLVGWRECGFLGLLGNGVLLVGDKIGRAGMRGVCGSGL
jgi:hypothetical protein